MSTEETPKRANTAAVLAYAHEERMAQIAKVTAPEPRIELDYKKVAGADPLTTWHLEVVPGFDEGEWQRMLDTAKKTHAALLAEFAGAKS
jgi:hypothetical protein